MPIYYTFTHEQEREILDGKGLSNFSSIYADGKIEEPVYDKKTDKFVVRYHSDTKEGKIKWLSKSFDNKSAATSFYLDKYREYMYCWTLMFYEEFKPGELELKKGRGR